MASHTIVDWGPHGMWLSNCSDDINSTVCDYATQVAWKVTNTTMEQYLDKGLLGWLDGVEWHLLVLGLSSINKLGLNYRTYGNLVRAPKSLELGPDISQESVVVIIISFIIINHISYKLVFPFLLF